MIPLKIPKAIELTARELCVRAGENPDEPRWHKWIEQATATVRAREAEKAKRSER